MTHQKQNRKGKLSAHQLREYEDAFNMYDKMNKGCITQQDLSQIVRELGYNPTESELSNIFWTVDGDGDNKINFTEFLSVIKKLGEIIDKDGSEYMDAFHAFDREGRGFVPSAWVRDAVIDMMEHRSEAEMQDVLRTFNLHVDRKVGFSEFKSMLHAPMNR